jgi:hypothetical protein
LQIALDVVAECFERGNVNDVRGVVEFSFDSEAHQVIDSGQKGGECFARAGGRGDQSVPMFFDGRPRLGLRRGRRGKTLRKPARHRWMKYFEIHRDGYYTAGAGKLHS